MTEAIQKYLATEDKKERLLLLSAMKEQDLTMPIGIVEDLLCMRLDTDEKIALLDVVSSSEPIAFENFLVTGSLYWDQNLSSLALKKWAHASQHLLWFRWLRLLSKLHVSQRMKYTLLDCAFCMPAQYVFEHLLASEGLEELSPAFHSLLLLRSLQWQISHPRIAAIAYTYLESMRREVWPEGKPLPVLIPWLAKFEPLRWRAYLQDLGVSSGWRDLGQGLALSWHGEKKDLKRLHSLPLEGKGSAFWQEWALLWPPIWRRDDLPIASLRLGLAGCLKHLGALPGGKLKAWEWFAGVNHKTLVATLLDLDDGQQFARAIALLKGLLPYPPTAELLDKAKCFLQQMEQPQEFLAALPLRFRLALQEGEGEGAMASRWQVLVKEEREFLSTSEAVSTGEDLAAFSRAHTLAGEEQSGRQLFFDLAYRQKTLAADLPRNEDDFWSFLACNWQKPTAADLPRLALLARQEPSLYHLCYIRTLSRFQGEDSAVLKLLDYMRTSRREILREVIHALAGIGTLRSLQELVVCLTRPNMDASLQLDICQLLRGRDLSALQAELRSAMDDLLRQAAQGEAAREVCEALSALISVDQGVAAMVPAATSLGAGMPGGANPLDASLKERIPYYDQLSTEVRRALRTARFFHNQVEEGQSYHGIDLSPVIDMQYKALELIFRECFEEPCFRLVNQGVLQRKLDVIGYARPIPKAMDAFENYIGSLPIISDIPYFSKFKLRKLLRAICQYRPGRRFTLDGIKAFALFFLCFGRKQCPYQLAGVFPVGFAQDEELFAFCKLLHIFQDFRNRAAHEGFRPEARNDMEGIWKNTAQIIQIVYQQCGKATAV